MLDDPDKRARMGKIGQERIGGPLSWSNSQASLLAAYTAACRNRDAVPHERSGAHKEEEAAQLNEDTIRLVTIGRILRRRWRLLAVLAVVGALFGYGTSVLVFPPRYTASAPVLLPGVWEERELLTQVDIATSLTVVDRAADALHWSDVSRSELQDDVSASAADGNIITISGTADTPERAQRLADAVAQQFVQFAAQVAGSGTDASVAAQTEALRKQVTETNRRISELADAADPGQTVESVQSRTALENLRTSLEAAMKKLEEADPSTGKSGMVVMGEAPGPPVRHRRPGFSSPSAGRWCSSCSRSSVTSSPHG